MKEQPKSYERLSSKSTKREENPFGDISDLGFKLFKKLIKVLSIFESTKNLNVSDKFCPSLCCRYYLNKYYFIVSENEITRII